MADSPTRASRPTARPSGQSGQHSRVQAPAERSRPPAERSRPPAEWRTAREDVLVRLMFTPGSSPLEATHTFLEAFLAERVPPAAAQRVCLAAYELLSNATSYATLGSDVVFEIVQRQTRVCVRASNNTIAARVAMLQQQLDKIRADPEETFVAELRRSMTSGVARPMLGLARIAHEVGLELELETSGARVTVTALPR